MRLSSTFRVLTGLSVALAGIAGCTSKANITPAEGPCATSATVRFCYGYTAVCLTQHTTLELADGTRLRPSGAIWEAYRPKQIDGEVLRISYALVPHNAYDSPGVTFATLTCLETPK